MNNVMQACAQAQSGEMRAGSNFDGERMAAADFTMSPTIDFSRQGSQGGSAASPAALLNNGGAAPRPAPRRAPAKSGTAQ